jgi:hypothetical protein
MPGAGKSTICDPIWHHKAITWDGLPPPAYWRPFIDEITTLFGLIRRHPTIEAAVRMNNRSLRKMATVGRMDGDKTYIHTGLVQRGLGFGWRLADMGADVNLIRRYFWLMPVSLGVAWLKIDPETVKERNRARRLVPATAHEDRSHMIAPMMAALPVALDVLHERGVSAIEIDTTLPVDDARQLLIDYADKQARDTPPARSGGEVPLLSLPAWWG